MPWTVWVWIRPTRVVPMVAPVSPAERRSIALIREVLPTGPVPNHDDLETLRWRVGLSKLHRYNFGPGGFGRIGVAGRLPVSVSSVITNYLESVIVP